MRNSKIIAIEGRGEVTVKEVSPLGIWRAMRTDNQMESLLTLLDDAVEPPAREIAGWYPSEIRQVVEAVLKVNQDFFVTARLLKVDGLITEMANAAASNLPKLFASSFSAAMLEPGTTAGGSL